MSALTHSCDISLDIDIYKQRQINADKLSNLLYDTVHAHKSDAEAWISDDETGDCCDHARSCGNRRSISSIASGRCAHLRHSSRRSIHRIQRARSDQRWIALLERNNEELVAQISTLTSDLCRTEKTIKNSLTRHESEIHKLRTQLTELVVAAKKPEHEPQPGDLRRRTSQEDTSRTRCDVSDRSFTADIGLRNLVQERDTLKRLVERQEDELLRTKRRNAALAERVAVEDIQERPKIIARHSSPPLQQKNRVGASGQKPWLNLLSPTERALMASPRVPQPEHDFRWDDEPLAASPRVDAREQFSERFKGQPLMLTPPLSETSFHGRVGPKLRSSLQELPVIEHQNETSMQCTQSKRPYITTIWTKKVMRAKDQVRSALTSLQWIRFIILLCFAVGLTLKDGPEITTKEKKQQRRISSSSESESREDYDL